MIEVDTGSWQEPGLIRPNDFVADEQVAIIRVLEEDDRATGKGGTIERTQ
ncbi:MAG TPA: hypothetical protein VFR60_04210 [Sphingomicrobium sp.]|nr:hypothetical protein [Sphingomicrobium sp.]